MYLSSEKKKPVFSSSKDIKENNFDLEPVFVEEVSHVNLENTSERNVFYEIIIKIPVDRKMAVENEASYFTAFAIKDPTADRAKYRPFDDFLPDKASMNYAIYNKEILAKKHMKQKDKVSGKYKLFDADITTSILKGLSKKALEDKSPEEAFGIETFLVPRTIEKNPEKEKNSLDIDFSVVEPKNNKFFGVDEAFAKKNVPKINKQKFKREYLKLKRAGRDPAVFISKSKPTSQSMKDFLSGKVPKEISKRNYDSSQIGEMFHLINELKIEKQEFDVSVSKSKRVKRHVIFEKKITISEDQVKKLSSSKFYVVIYARDSRKRKIDHYTTVVDLNKLKAQKKTRDAVLSHKKVSAGCVRSGNSVYVSSYNGCDHQARVHVDSCNISNFQNPIHHDYEKIKVQIMEPYERARVTDSRYKVHKAQSAFFRLKPEIKGYRFGETIFLHAPSPSPGMNSSSAAEVGMTANNLEDAVVVNVSNLPEEAVGCNLVKRNLTKRENKFNLIMSHGEVGLISGGKRSIRPNPPVFDISAKSNHFTRFIDNDVEEADTYEYKLLYYKDNGEACLSCSSLVHLFEERKNIVRIEVLEEEMGSMEDELINSQPMDEPTVLLRKQLYVEVKKTAIDTLFESLDRNTYELLSDQFDNIRSLIKQSVSCIVYLENVDKIEMEEIGRFTPTKEGIINIEVPITDFYSRQLLVVEPRVKSSESLIDNIFSKIQSLKTSETNLPLSNFVKVFNLFVEKTKNTTDQKFISRVGDKYNTRSVRMSGTIVDERTRYIIEGDDVYYDGRTGDIFKYKIENLQLSDGIGALQFKNMKNVKNIKDKDEFGVLLTLTSQKSRYVDFYCLYTKSNGSLKCVGMISPTPGKSQDNYQFYVDMSRELGLVDLHVSTVLKDGTMFNPKRIASFIVYDRIVRKL